MPSFDSAQRPHALFPQIRAVLGAEKPMLLFAKREGPKFTVSTRELGPEMDAGEEQIRKFQEEYEENGAKLSSVYPVISNQDLAAVSDLAELMRLKGVELEC